eukprot:g6048.t1
MGTAVRDFPRCMVSMVVAMAVFVCHQPVVAASDSRSPTAEALENLPEDPRRPGNWRPPPLSAADATFGLASDTSSLCAKNEEGRLPRSFEKSNKSESKACEIHKTTRDTRTKANGHLIQWLFIFWTCISVRRRLLQQLGGVERCVRDRKHVPDVLNAHRAAFPVLEQVHLLDLAGPQRQSDQGDSCLWAHLADAPAGQERTFADLMLAAAVRSQSGVKMENDQSPLVFDFSLWRTRLGRKFAAALAPYPLFPHVDFLAAAQTAAMPVSGSAFPTLFANFDAPTRGAGPHVDFSGTHFYQLVCCGKKRYRLASPRSLPLLRPLYLDDLSSPWLPTDALRVDGHKAGSGASSVDEAVLDLVPIYETEVRAGEAIFVPSGWAHEVENVEATIAISGNFVDRTNYEEVLGQLECEARCGFEGPRVLGEELRDLDVAKLEEEQLKLMVGLGRAGGGTDAKESKKMQDEREAKKKVAQRKLYRDFALNVGVVMLWFFIIASVFFPNWSTVWF